MTDLRTIVRRTSASWTLLAFLILSVSTLNGCPSSDKSPTEDAAVTVTDIAQNDPVDASTGEDAPPSTEDVSSDSTVTSDVAPTQDATEDSTSAPDAGPIDPLPPSAWNGGDQLEVLEVGPTYARIRWTTNTESKGLHYRVFANGESRASVQGDHAIVTRLTPGENHVISVQMRDENTSWSNDGPTISVGTQEVQDCTNTP